MDTLKVVSMFIAQLGCIPVIALSLTGHRTASLVALGVQLVALFIFLSL